jgi:phosphoribosylaminoimidazole-succinocarboxamide synthase
MTVGEKILPLKLLRKGKVREVYDLGDKLLLVSSDRVSAFDFVLSKPVPDKGKILTQISRFWFEKTRNIVANHLICVDLNAVQNYLPFDVKLGSYYDGRTMLVRKTERIDFECVVRGYLAGSGWKDYQTSGSVCGCKLPRGLKQAQKLGYPIFTPATKADTGHDENVEFGFMSEKLGSKLAGKLKDISLRLYDFAAGYLEKRGLILADTKFEFGLLGGKLILIDELFTPDSSRFWDKKSYKVGVSPDSFDKQIIRDWLEKTGWDKKSAPPQVPDEVIEKTAARYVEVLKLILS